MADSDLSDTSAGDATAGGWPPGGAMAWDIGANVGMTLPLLTSLYGYVVAFEPAVESWNQLELSWGKHDKVRLVNKAVSWRDGTVQLAVRPDPMASGQLVAPGMQWDWGPEVALRDVPSVTLDTLMEEYGIPDFVKIDTEGGELKVLRGGPRLLAEQATCWMTEFHSLRLHNACEAVFTAAGYDVETGRPARFDEGSAEWHDYGWLKARPRA